MNLSKVKWNNEGWTTIQEADPKMHTLEIMCHATRGIVDEVKVRHHDGEEKKSTVMLDGKNALPMNIKAFKELCQKDQLEFK